MEDAVHVAIIIMEDDIWVRMRIHPEKLLYKRSHCPGNEKNKL